MGDKKKTILTAADEMNKSFRLREEKRDLSLMHFGVSMEILSYITIYLFGVIADSKQEIDDIFDIALERVNNEGNKSLECFSEDVAREQIELYKKSVKTIFDAYREEGD